MTAFTLFSSTCPHCAGHLNNNQTLCDKCAPDHLPYSDPRCNRCGNFLHSATTVKGKCLACHQPPFFRVQTGFEFNDQIRHALHQVKYGRQSYWLPYFAACLTDLFPEISTQYDAMIAVPLHRSRLRQRGFNQAQVLAELLSKRNHLPLKDFGLRRTIATDYQAQSEAQQRSANVLKAFSRKGAKGRISLNDKRILIIDDIITSGATLAACARVLRPCRTIHGLCIARAMGSNFQ